MTIGLDDSQLVGAWVGASKIVVTAIFFLARFCNYR